MHCYSKQLRHYFLHEICFVLFPEDFFPKGKTRSAGFLLCIEEAVACKNACMKFLVELLAHFYLQCRTWGMNVLLRLFLYV